MHAHVTGGLLVKPESRLLKGCPVAQSPAGFVAHREERDGYNARRAQRHRVPFTYSFSQATAVSPS